MGKTKWPNLFSFPSHIELLKEGSPSAKKEVIKWGEKTKFCGSYMEK